MLFFWNIVIWYFGFCYVLKCSAFCNQTPGSNKKRGETIFCWLHLKSLNGIPQEAVHLPELGLSSGGPGKDIPGSPGQEGKLWLHGERWAGGSYQRAAVLSCISLFIWYQAGTTYKRFYLKYNHQSIDIFEIHNKTPWIEFLGAKNTVSIPQQKCN